MATEGEEPKKSFKVVDRRRFHEDGTAREGPDVQPDRPRVDPPVPAPAVPAKAAAAPAPTAAVQQDAGAPPPAQADGNGKKPPAAEEAPNGLSFSIFLQSLAQQALMQLGLIPWPHGQRELHLDQARDTID